MASARSVALDCLCACERQGAWSDGYLKNSVRAAGLSPRDAALCTRLTFGVLQNKMLLDWHLGRFCSVKIEKLEPAIRGILRLGLYQLLFLDRVPAHAAIHESVELSKAHSRNPKASGLVNAVMRRAQREREAGLPEPEALSVRYSHPQWLVDEFSALLPGDEVLQLLALNNTPVDTVAQVNTLRSNADALRAELCGAGIEARLHPWLEQCLLLKETGDLTALSAFSSGELYIQDAAARLAVMAAGPGPGMKVLDACAAPGGKSFAAAIEMGDEGSILACDIHPHKLRLIEGGGARLGISCIDSRVLDAKVFCPELEQAFDLVIADVPCSGLGIIRKKPDIRYKDPALLEGLPRVQLDILRNVSRYVRPGGVLLYATCTVLPRENEDIVTAFLNGAGRDFSLTPASLPGGIDMSSGMVTLWPQRNGTDGFFFAKLRRG